jgi:chromosome segregation ATPase
LLVKQMKSLEEELETLHKAEEQLAKDFAAAASQPESDEQEETLQQLQKRQAELREELADIERQLEHLELKRPRDAVRRAGERMEQLSQQSQTPQQRSESLRETMDDLEQSRRELAEERRQAEEELAFEQMLKLHDELKGLAIRQTGVFDEVKRLENLRDEHGDLRRALTRTLKQTAATELELAQVVEGLTKRMETVEALALTLKKLNQRMTDVAGKLEETQTNEPVQKALQSIEDQIQRLIAVLDASAAGGNSAEQPPDEESQQPTENQAAGPPGDVITLIAQLELLKDLQEDCQRRTQEIQQDRGETAELTPEQTAELESLQRDQTQLTDLARNLLTKLLQNEPPASPADAPKEGQ